MAERRENSVLFSLKELRGIEDGRVKKEREDAAARLEAERAAKEASERAVREASERVRREEEDRLRRIEEEKENRVREEQMRLQEAERRARVDGEVRIQEERMRLDAQAKQVHKSPLKAIVSVTAVLVVVAGGLGYKMYNDHQAELAVQRSKLAEAQADAQREKAELEAKYEAIAKERDRKLAAAQTDAEKAQIRLEAERARAAAQTHKPSHSAGKSDESKPAAPQRNVKKHEISDDPLEGLR